MNYPEIYDGKMTDESIKKLILMFDENPGKTV
jgi:hypothetical protein